MLINRFSGWACRRVGHFGISQRMTDGQVVKLDSGVVAQVKRVAVTGAPYVSVLLAVTVPPEPVARPPTQH
jgi:hypothetical protein